MLFYKEKELKSLIEKFSQGEEEAFSDMVRLASCDVINIAYHYTSNYEDAKDVAQEVFLKLYRKIQTFSHSSKLSTWLYRIVVNASIDFLRRRRKTVSLQEAITKDTTEHGAILGEIDKKDMHCRIVNSIERLSAKQKKVIILKHFEGLKISQISKIMGCSQSSIKTHLVRAVENIRKKVGGMK